MPQPKKRPPNAYALFMKNEFRSRQNNVQPTEHTKAVAKKWRELDSSQKQIWMERAARVRSMFPRRQAAGSSSRKAKKPRSAFIFFCSERREQAKRENPNKKITVIAKILGKMWKKLSAEEKSRYTKMAESDKKRYYGGRVPKSSKGGQRSGTRTRTESSPHTHAVQRTQARNPGRTRDSTSRNSFFSRPFTSSSESSDSGQDHRK